MKVGLRIRFVVLIALIALVTPAFAQDRAAETKLAFDRAQHLRQGFNADFIGRLDHVVDQMLAKGLAVQIDIHPESDYKKKVSTTGEGVERFLMLWRRL